MALPATKTEQRPTLAEFLEREEIAEQKHEYHDGEVLAMSGATYIHVRITMNLIFALGNRLGDSGCQVLHNDMGVSIESSNRFVYPDASIVCGPPQFNLEDSKQRTLINPRVIFEVPSESTEAYDRGEKFNHYRRIPTLEEVILIGQDSPVVEGFLRQDDEAWSMMTYEGLEQKAVVRSLGLDLPLGELYEGAQST